jgi:hypothetical protein
MLFASSVMQDSIENFGGNGDMMIGNLSIPRFHPQFCPEYTFHTAHHSAAEVRECNSEDQDNKRSCQHLLYDSRQFWETPSAFWH